MTFSPHFRRALPAMATSRDVQGQVLDAWMKRRDTDRDLSIKMNTGTGKTIVGLLILRSALNEAAGPALYVAPDNYLAGQVRKQADRLGLATVDDPESTSYVSGQSNWCRNHPQAHQWPLGVRWTGE